MNPPLTIALCAGEASGDMLGAHLMSALLRHHPNAQFVGIGGPRMKALGMHSFFDQEELAVCGLVEVLHRLPSLLRIRRTLVRTLLKQPPDIFVGIDAPDFNLGVAERLKKRGIPTVHYVSPSVWAWRQKRIPKIARQVDEVLCLFPMEPELYQKAGGKACFVGHPLAEELPLTPPKKATRELLHLSEHQPVFALLPGSRVSEINYMAPVFLQAAKLVQAAYPAAQFLIPVATAATRERLLTLIQRDEFAELSLNMMFAHANLACTAADAALVASGTATLEVALCGCPMVISYRISPLTYAWVKRKIRVPHVGLPNVLLNKEVAPELLQHNATPEKLATALIQHYENHELRDQVKQEFRALHQLLKHDTSALAADAILQHIQRLKHVR